MRSCGWSCAVLLAGCGRWGFDEARTQDGGAVDDAVDGPVDAGCGAVDLIPAPSPVAAIGPSSLALGDLDGDGRLDLVAGNFNAGSISVFLGNGDGTFRPKVDYQTSSSPGSVAIGDLHGDARLDVVVTSGAATVGVFRGNGDGTLQTRLDLVSGAFPSAVVIADLDGNAAPDLAATNNNDSTISVLLGNGNGTFQSKVDYPTAGAPNAIVACLLYTSPSPRDGLLSRMPSSA